MKVFRISGRDAVGKLSIVNVTNASMKVFRISGRDVNDLLCVITTCTVPQ